MIPHYMHRRPWTQRNLAYLSSVPIIPLFVLAQQHTYADNEDCAASIASATLTLYFTPNRLHPLLFDRQYGQCRRANAPRSLSGSFYFVPSVPSNIAYAVNPVPLPSHPSSDLADSSLCGDAAGTLRSIPRIQAVFCILSPLLVEAWLRPRGKRSDLPHVAFVG